MLADGQLHKHERLLLVVTPNNVWAKVCGDNVCGECMVIDVSQVSCWGEFRFHKVYSLYSLSQNCIVTVVIASEVSCHTGDSAFLHTADRWGYLSSTYAG